MGWGDELMVSGEARRIMEQNPNIKKVAVLDRLGRVKRHSAWLHNPRISTTGDTIGDLATINYKGLRPYIERKTVDRWYWKKYSPPVGELYFAADEWEYAAQFVPDVIIEPWIKAKASPNKQWGTGRWQALVDLMRARGFEPVQLGGPNTQVLNGVRLIETPSLRHASAVLARARAAVLPEGGLHHSAAVVRTPAVVLFGGFISPEQTGYAEQANIFTGGSPCGMRTPCRHCQQAMAAIEPDFVMEVLEGVLSERALRRLQ